MILDPRTTPWREDLAAADLEGVRASARYADRERRTCLASVADLRRSPSFGAEQVDQLLFGETFDVLERRDGWAWGQAARDGYVGWVLEAALGPPIRPTHRVVAVTSRALNLPEVKAPAGPLLPLNALVRAEAEEGRFVRVEAAGWLPAAHLQPVGEGFEADPVAVAERLLGAPYLWSGRTALGVDCSGLVQAAWHACGRGCPRDSDQQEAALGRPLAEGEAPRRGDLAFWDGHVGLMTDAETLLHANAWRMAVACEPLAEAAVRQGSAPRLRRVLG